jgi:hypothetical protein
MHDKMHVLAQDVARLRDELELYRTPLIYALEQIQGGLPHSIMWDATTIRGAAERLVKDIAVFSGHHIPGEKQTLTHLIGQLRNKVPKLTPKLGQPEQPYHTWITRLEAIDRIVGGAPHPWVPPAQLDSLMQSVEDLLKLLQELYCKYGTSPTFPTIYFDVTPLVVAYKEKEQKKDQVAFIPLDTELMFTPDVIDSDYEPGEDEEYQDEPRLQPVEKAKGTLGPVPILKALSEHPRITILVLGDAGSGKTQTAIAFCREFNAVAEYNVAIHIRLKLFGDGGMDALIRRSLGDTLPAERPLEKFGPEWNLALVCDGLDECSESRRKECIRSICELTKLNVRVVVLSRERGLQLDQLPAWTTYKLNAFDDGQRDAFLRSRLPTWAAKERTALVHQINSQPGGAYLYRNPFFLYVLTELLTLPKLPADGALVYTDDHGDGNLSQYDYKPPQALSRVRIMRMLVERTLKSELRKLGKSAEQYLRPLLGAFSRAGFNSLLSEEGSFTADAFYSWYLKELRDTRRLVRSDLERLLVRMLDFLPDAGLYRFPHQNIETFLAAWHLYKHPGDGNQITQDATRDCTHVLSFLLEMGARHASSPPKGKSELRTVLDASLYRIAWELDPLLAVIGHKRDANYLREVAYGPVMDVRPGILEDPWTRGLVRCCLDRHATCEGETNEIAEERGCSIPYLLSQRLRDPWLWYAGTFSANSKERVRRLKRLMTTQVEPWGALIEYAAEGHRSWKEELGTLPLFERFAYGLAYLDEQVFLELATAYAVNDNPRLWALFVLRGGERGYHTNSLWTMLVPFVNQLSFRQLHRLIIKKALFSRFGHWLDSTEKTLLTSLLSRERLIPVLYNIFPTWMIVREVGSKEEIKSRLLANLTPICAHEAVRWRILKPKDIPSDTIRAWCQRADPSEAGKLAGHGIATKDDFPRAKLEAWTKSVGVTEAMRLAEGGLLTGVDFDKQLRDTWRASKNRTPRYRLLATRVLPKDDFGPEELHEWLASFNTRRLYTLVEKGLVGRDDFGQTYIDALRQVTAADCQDGDKPSLYGPPLLVRLGVVYPRDRYAIPEQVLERAAKGGRTVKKLWFDLGILTVDDLWRFESSDPWELTCLSFVITDIVRQMLVRVYHPKVGFQVMDLQRVQHLRPEINAGSVIMAPIVSTRSAGGITLLPSHHSVGLCTRTADLSKLLCPGQNEDLTNEALVRLRALIRDEISAEEAQATESADLESKGVRFSIPVGGRLEEQVLKSMQEQLVGKWFTLRVEYLNNECGDVFHPLFVNNPELYPSSLLGTKMVSRGDYIFAPVFVECSRGRHVFAVQRGAVWVGQCASGPEL